jgi:membrane-associated phospholipid phosphatase
MFRSRIGLTLLLALVFAVNLAETAAEGRIGPEDRLAPQAYKFAHAMQSLERYLTLERFENHDATSRAAVYGFSISYFFLFPMLCISIGFALALREDIEGYRVLCLAVAIDYLVSLGFFLFMPVPERWSYPDSGAMLLSDLWSSKLIEAIRPISGLDNCFPSSHVSLTVILMLVCFRFQVRLRTTVAALGFTVILATFVLGVHWVPDMVAGVAAGWLSVTLARASGEDRYSRSISLRLKEPLTLTGRS